MKNIRTPARIRLDRDLDNLELPPCVTLKDMDYDPAVLLIYVSPDEGYYKGGTFEFRLEFSNDYPIRPPRVACLTKLFHPNIDLRGRVCLNILREAWTPVLDLQSIVIGLLFLFLEPNDKDPLNKEAANLLSSNRYKFAEYVRAGLKDESFQNP